MLWEGSQGEREDQVRVSLRSVDGCGSNGQKKLRKPAIVIVYILYFFERSYLKKLNHTLTETRNLNWSFKNLVGVASVAKCWR